MNHIFDSTEESYTIRHLTDRVRSVNVGRTFCPLNIRYIFTLSVIHPFLIRQSPLVDHSLSHYLSVKYALLMRFMSSSHAPRRPSSPSRRLSSLDERRIKKMLHFFCPFGVRNHYPLICDSTMNVQHLHLNKVGNTFAVVDLPKCVLFEYICSYLGYRLIGSGST